MNSFLLNYTFIYYSNGGNFRNHHYKSPILQKMYCACKQDWFRLVKVFLKWTPSFDLHGHYCNRIIILRNGLALRGVNPRQSNTNINMSEILN